MYENSTLYSHFCSFSPANVTTFLAPWHKLKIVIDLKKLQHLIVFIANFYDKILNA